MFRDCPFSEPNCRIVDRHGRALCYFTGPRWGDHCLLGDCAQAQRLMEVLDEYELTRFIDLLKQNRPAIRRNSQATNP